MHIIKPANDKEYRLQQEARHTSLEHEYPLSPWSLDMLREFKEYLKEPIIDIGTRNGLLLEELAARGYKDAVGIELTDIAKFAQKQGRNVIQADIQKRLPFPDKHFKSAIAMQVFEHCYDPVAAFAETRRILDGYMYINLPLQGDVTEWVRFGHYTGFGDVNEMKKFFKENGFAVIKEEFRHQFVQMFILKTV